MKLACDSRENLRTLVLTAIDNLSEAMFMPNSYQLKVDLKPSLQWPSEQLQPTLKKLTSTANKYNECTRTTATFLSTQIYNVTISSITKHISFFDIVNNDHVSDEINSKLPAACGLFDAFQETLESYKAVVGQHITELQTNLMPYHNKLGEALDSLSKQMVILNVEVFEKAQEKPTQITADLEEAINYFETNKNEQQSEFKNRIFQSATTTNEALGDLENKLRLLWQSPEPAVAIARR